MELATLRPTGFRYVTVLLDDGVTFVHAAITARGHDTPLSELGAFEAFRARLPQRCTGPPVAVSSSELIGSYDE